MSSAFPRALKDGLPGCTPPFAHSFGHNFPVPLVLSKQRQLRDRIRGARGELFLTLQKCFCHSIPFAQDTLYCRRACTAVISLNGGSEFRLLMTTGRAPHVARGPRALKDGLPAFTLPFAHSFGHNFPVLPVLPNRRSREAETGGRGGNYFPRRGTGRSPDLPFLPLPFLPFLQKRRRGGGASAAFFITSTGGYSPSFHSLWTRATTSSTADCCSGGQTTMRGLPESTFFV